MRGKKLELVGQKYGRLLVIGYAGKDKYERTRWECLCDCGNEKVISAHSLRQGATKSCGCLYEKTEKPGARYGKLVIIKRAKKVNSQVFWHCLCDCGNRAVVYGKFLRGGDTKSCGCLAKFKKGQATFNRVFASMKAGAKRRGHKWNLSRKQVEKMTQKNCFYCGLPPSNKHQAYSCNGGYVYSGIDRIDNNKGYMTENVVPCCDACNKGKQTKNIDEFLNWFKRLVLHNQWNYKNINAFKFKGG